MTKAFPVIDPVATGQNILRLRKSRGLSVRELQDWFGFEEPQAIYKWQKGKSLPTVDNLYALSALLNVPMQDILVPFTPQLNRSNGAVSNEICPPFLCKIPICRSVCTSTENASSRAKSRDLRTNKLIKSLIMRGFLDSLRKLRSLEMTRLGEIVQNGTER